MYIDEDCIKGNSNMTEAVHSSERLVSHIPEDHGLKFKLVTK
jgi:hypothetical protein